MIELKDISYRHLSPLGGDVDDGGDVNDGVVKEGAISRSDFSRLRNYTKIDDDFFEAFGISSIESDGTRLTRKEKLNRLITVEVNKVRLKYKDNIDNLSEHERQLFI
jgi:hypothetical protein